MKIIGFILLFISLMFSPIFGQYVSQEEFKAQKEQSQEIKLVLQDHIKTLEKEVEKNENSIVAIKDLNSEISASLSKNTEAINNLKDAVCRINTLIDRFILFLIGTFITAGMGGSFVGYSYGRKRNKKYEE